MNGYLAISDVVVVLEVVKAILSLGTVMCAVGFAAYAVKQVAIFFDGSDDGTREAFMDSGDGFHEHRAESYALYAESADNEEDRQFYLDKAQEHRDQIAAD